MSNVFGHGDRGVTLEDFRALPSGAFIFMPCREPWVARAVDIAIGPQKVLDKQGKPKRDRNGKIITMSASAWLMKHQRVEQMAWVPGEPALIRDRLLVEGGWINRSDVTMLNLYRPPRIELGDAAEAGPWLEHVHRIYPDDATQILRWLAHRRQQPQDKINFNLVLGGGHGIGKDTLLEPARYAVGPWNFHDVIPSQLLGRFNNFAKSVILRVNEAHDQGDTERVNRFNLYERIKNLSVTPPYTLRIDEKYIREYYVFNCMGIVITTNHKTDGIYLDPDDRRHYVAWSDCRKEDFSEDYWTSLHQWYQTGGFEHVTAYLAALDLSDFDAKAPLPQTQAFFEIVSAGEAPEDLELQDTIRTLKEPDGPEAVTLIQLIAAANGALAEWLSERKNRRALPHRLERCGYIAIKSPTTDRGHWVIDHKQHRIYAKSTLSARARLEAAHKLAQRMTTTSTTTKAKTQKTQT